MGSSEDARPLEELLNCDPPVIYHERQSQQLCAVHALNNLFCNHEAEVAGAPTALAQIFTKQMLEEIAAAKYEEEQQLGLASGGFFEFNRNRSAIGIGNYSVVVLETAVCAHGDYSWCQFDVRKGVDAIPSLNDLVGIVANKPTSALMGAWKGRHWYTIRRCRGYDLNLDSKLEVPVAFVAEHGGCDAAGGAGETLRDHLQLLIDGGGSVFLVPQAEPGPRPEQVSASIHSGA